tara:strand:+ start:1762 stop:2880 length:1119 start_codon:yes stop_codon:yes gene_type:complete
MITKEYYYNNFYGWWKNIDKTILIIFLILLSLGLFFSLVSTSLIASNKLQTNSYYFFAKHLVFVVAGLFILFSFSILQQETLFNLSIILFLLFFVLLALVPFIGIEVKGSKRWIDIGSIARLQPIELLKPFFVITISIIFAMKKYQNKYFKYFISLFLLLPIVLFLISQPDLGQTLIMLFTWLVLVFVSGISLIIFFLFFSFFIGLTSYLIFFVSKFEYIKVRIMSFIDSSGGNNHQSEKASEAIISGGFFGKGIGEGTLNNRIPEAHTDYIVSVISEEFGIIIVISIILIFMLLTFQVIKKISLEDDNRIKLILLGLASILILQTFVHIGVNIRALPTTGMTLPFLSYGGSSIISNSILAGTILNLTRRKI